MKIFTPVFIASSLAFSAAPTSSTVTVNLVNRDNMPVGTATIEEAVKGVKISLDLKNMPPGERAIHFHEKGECLAPEFKTAGDHFAPTNKEHGHKSKKGPHAGDMKNITVGKDGTLKTDFINAYVDLKSGSPTNIMGKALVIHAAADDYVSQPAGNAGDRIACAVIR